MTRTPSQLGRYKCNKGKRAAREAVTLLRSFGFTAKNNPMHGVEGAADVLVTLNGVWRAVEVKNSTAIVPGRAAFDAAWTKCRDEADEADAVPLMLFRWGRTWGLCTLDPYWMRAIYIGPEIKRRLIEFNEGHAFARSMVGTRKQPEKRGGCTHRWTYHPDPSGNNDCHWTCSACGAWRDKRPEGAVKQPEKRGDDATMHGHLWDLVGPPWKCLLCGLVSMVRDDRRPCPGEQGGTP